MALASAVFARLTWPYLVIALPRSVLCSRCAAVRSLLSKVFQTCPQMLDKVSSFCFLTYCSTVPISDEITLFRMVEAQPWATCLAVFTHFERCSIFTWIYIVLKASSSSRHSSAVAAVSFGVTVPILNLSPFALSLRTCNRDESDERVVACSCIMTEGN